jgi:hypothetical protein
MHITPQQAVEISQVTGPNTSHWKMGGADLGVMWQSANTTFHVFGDNFTVVRPAQGGPTGTDWKANALGRSSALDFTNGIQFDNFNVDSSGDRTAPIPANLLVEDGVVPTAGIHVGSYDIMAYASFALNHTDQVQTRVGGTAYSVDGGNTWYRSNAAWDNNPQWTDKFQQSAFAYDGGQYIYRFTTEASRGGNIHLLRCPANAVGVINKAQYQYWTGSAWSTDPTQVAVLIQGPVGEMSARYDDLLGAWMILYHDDVDGYTVFQYASNPIGPWSAKLGILEDADYPIYAPEIHPQSSGTGLWFCGSLWSTYQTYLYYANLNVSCP